VRVPDVEGSQASRAGSARESVAEGDRRDETPAASEPTGRIEVAAMAGSLRAASWAQALLRATTELLPANVGLIIWDRLGEVPLFNQDLESGPAPAAVADLRQLIDRSDALLIATPEYNQSIPGVLKNALDWASRPFGETVLKDKPVAALGTSPLPTGGMSALSDVRKMITLLGADVVEADLTIGQVHTRIDAEGRISDAALAARVTELLVKVANHVASSRRQAA
jgi:chromate reductase, NAD(P)H dehydrogenase (quinone)